MVLVNFKECFYIPKKYKYRIIQIVHLQAPHEKTRITFNDALPCKYKSKIDRNKIYSYVKLLYE